MQTPLPEILELAREHQVEQEAFSGFVERLSTLLVRWEIPTGGRRAALADYLDQRAAAGITAADEQPVVDALTRQILEALGYRDGDYTYNQMLTDGPDRPDFTIRVDEFLGPLPVFLVEDKSTSVRDFERRQRKGAEEESPVEQLRRYVLAGAVHGRAGLLCNGWRLEAWEFGAEGAIRLVQIDLHGLARAALAGAELGQRPALRALWKRFSRFAFTHARELTERSLTTPPLGVEGIERVQKALSRRGRTQDLEAELLAHHERVWREQAADVRQTPESLVAALRDLIEQFAEDVLHQLDEVLARHRTYEAARAELAPAEAAARLRQDVVLRQTSFDLTKEDFELRLLAPLDEWCRRPRLEDLDEKVAAWLAALEPLVKLSNGPAAHPAAQLALAPATEPPQGPRMGVPKNGAANGKRKILQGMEAALRKVGQRAIEDYAAIQQLEEEYRATLRAADAYQTWARRVSSSALVGLPEAEFRREFARQTAYVYIIRLLLVRICEDKGLFRRKLSDGGLILWKERVPQYLDYASGRSYEYLTRMAYECAQNVYVHFYGASELFDWYRMDDKMLLRALLVLNAFNLEGIDTDIIGAVYGRYLEEGKHEQGRYYTPKALVTHMLDLAGWRGEEIVGRRLADLACGSGSFLVEACRRLLDTFRNREGRIPKAKLRPALEEVQRSLHGLEINPFACYLAETNLLIQVLDLLKQAKDEGITLVVDRFRIYCEDSLIVAQKLGEVSETSLFLLGKDRAAAEQIKARTGPFAAGFDVLVGNPPYVRADEDAPAWAAYRRRLENQEWFSTRHQKWDLYVPFVEQYHRLLADRPDARCCLVTIESLATAPYAEKLRELLLRKSTLHDVLVTRGLKLFEDAKWQDNLIFSFSRGAPAPEHRIRRSIAENRDERGEILTEPLDEIVQAEADPDRLFRAREQVELDLEKTVRLEEICYVSKGMVLHSNEKLRDGQIVLVPPSYDPGRFGEELVEDLGEQGKRIRHRVFYRDDLVAERPDEIHTQPYLDSREVKRGGLGRIQWLEYGEHTRCPARVSRPTFPELFAVPKMMFGSFTGVAVDDGSQDGFLMVAHTVRIAVRWAALAGVENRSLTKARSSLSIDHDLKPSRNYSDWYLCALALSEPIQRWLHAEKRSMKEDVYPDDIKAIPVKRISAAKQEPFVRLEKERHGLWRELVVLEEEGFRIGARIEIPVRALAERFRREHPEIEHLSLLKLPSSLVELKETALEQDLNGAKAIGSEVRVRRETVARVGEAVRQKEEVASLLARLLGTLPGSLAEISIELPRSERGLLALAHFLDEQEEGGRRRQTRIAEIQGEIDRLAWALYRPASTG
ncbi:MAG TPA: N-6 DNA methylase [Thermoanaerobaculia bacterium]|nr:N-6 DNA methylase [Thermoanaerobaculia bacterium]